jgi:hypothetical protein
MRVIARPTASIGERPARWSSLSAPRVCATAILAGVCRRVRRHAAHAATGHNRRRTAMCPRMPVAALCVRKWRWEPVRPDARATRDAGVEHRPPAAGMRGCARHMPHKPLPEIRKHSVARVCAAHRMASLGSEAYRARRLERRRVRDAQVSIVLVVGSLERHCRFDGYGSSQRAF